jgi:PAS domain S-box-containing protein
VLTRLTAPAWYTDANLLSLVICRAVNLSVEGGNCDASCFAYATLGLLAGPRFDDYRAGFRFGRLGYDLVETRGLKRFQARTYMNFGNVVLPWTRHVREGRDLVRRAFKAANETGDLVFAAFCCHHVNTNLLAAGDPLDEVQAEAEFGIAFAQKMRFGLGIDFVAVQLALVRTLRGSTPHFGCFDDEQFDERGIERRFSENPNLAIAECWYWIRKLQARFFAGDYAAALESSERAQPLLWTSPSLFDTAEYHFYGALARSASCESAAAGQRPQHVEALVAHHRQLEIWAANCPENFENRAALVGAEIARIEGRALDAMGLYEQAVRSARENGFVHNEALANELAGRFYLDRGLEKNGHAHLRDARACYALWGADGKTKQLDRLYPHLAAAERHRPAADNGSPVQQLDVASVVKASHAISGEIVLADLVDTLMRIVLENAGAQTGHLLLLRDERLVLTAEAGIEQQRIQVRLHRDPAPPESALPASIINYVRRSRERVLLADATQSNLFSTDGYFASRQPKSVLCLPIMRRSTLIGLLYLENNLATHAFTSERVTVLELLASQAAISLENALLYTQLREREARIRRLVESNVIGVHFWDLSGGLTEANDAFLRTVGYSRQDLLSGNVSWASMTPQEYRAADAHAIEELAQSGTFQPYEKEYIRKDGERVPVLLAGAAFEGSSEQGVAFILDLTERKAAEAELARSEEVLREQASLLDLTHDTVFVRDMDDVITYWNHGAEELYGWHREEAVGKTAHQVLQTRFPEPLAEINAQLLRTDRWEGELVHTKRDGAQVVVASRWALQRDERGDPVAVLETNNDITEQRMREHEREEMQRRLQQAAKMEAIGRLAGGIAHDFNNVLSGILGYGETLVEETPEASPLRRYAQNMLTAANRGRALVDQILTYSRSQRGKRTPVDIVGVVAETLELVRGSLPANVRLEARVPESPLIVIGDATQLHQAAMNLCRNAIQAMSAGGTLRVALEAADVADERALSHGTLRPGRHVCLSVEDFGCGMEEATLSRIFEPFFTTKEIGQGTGLGLSIVYAIVADAGGVIDVKSAVKQGSTFAIFLPLVGIAAAAPAETGEYVR